LNTAFNGTGMAFAQISSATGDFANAVAVQANGAIVVAGGNDSTSTQNLYQFYLARFTASGKLDSTFGTGGQEVLASPTGQYPDSNWKSLASALAIDPATGNILAVGDAGSGRGQAAMVELNSNGTLNTAFGNGAWLLDNTGQSWSSVIGQPPTASG